MPFKSKSQARLFYAAAKGKVKGMDKSMAQKFIDDTDHQKIGRLPEQKMPKLRKMMRSK